MYNPAMAVEALVHDLSFLPLDPSGPYRIPDYLALPDAPRCELLAGHLVVTPAPTFRHQLALTLIADVLLRYARSVGGRTVSAPIDVVLADETVVQPDISLLTPRRLARVGDRIEGAPDLVVEILSPGSAARDRRFKLALYAASDLEEYWIVDPQERTVDFLVRGVSGFEIVPLSGAVYRSPRFSGLELDLPALWAELDAPPPVA